MVTYVDETAELVAVQEIRRRALDIILVILMALMILAYVGKGVGNVVLTLVLLEWAYYARTDRKAHV